jgi:outer membrane protein OmpA-like peptidoglycan-associated protein
MQRRAGQLRPALARFSAGPMVAVQGARHVLVRREPKRRTIVPRAIVAAAAGLAAAIVALPAAAQSYGPCQGVTGGVQMAGPYNVLFDLGSAKLRPTEAPTIAEAVQKAKDRQVSTICLIGHADKIGDPAANERLSRARAEAVANEMKRQGISGNKLRIDPKGEAAGKLNFGRLDASVKDRSVTILFAR